MHLPQPAATVRFAAVALQLPQKLRQLGDIERNPSRLIAREQLGGRSAARLI
jgi:hypothetical protein